MVSVNTSIGAFNNISPAGAPERPRAEALERPSGQPASNQSAAAPQPAPSRPSTVVTISEQARQALEADRVQAERVQASERRDRVQAPETPLNRLLPES